MLDIIRAEGAFRIVVWRVKPKLSCRIGLLEFVAEVPEVFRADVEVQNFLDHRREVRQ